MIEHKIFKDPEGLKLFKEFASDIADPKACNCLLVHQPSHRFWQQSCRQAAPAGALDVNMPFLHAALCRAGRVPTPAGG